MEKSEFENLLWRYKAGVCSEDEIRRIHLWISELNEDSDLKIPEDEKEALQERLKRSIDVNIREAAMVSRWRAILRPRNFIRAAMILMVLAAGTYFIPENKIATKNTGNWLPVLKTRILNGSWYAISKENDGDVPLNLTLPDGSQVALLPGSTITYRDPFNKKEREVTLIGNAFFEITKDSSRPFSVFHGNLITQVLGTSFWIKSDALRKTQEVEVVTGKVRLREKKNRSKEQEILLEPSQKATYDEERGELIQPPPQIPRQAVATTVMPQFNFENETLGQIKNALENGYGTEIVLATPKIEDCTFTGDVSNLPLNEALELICRSIQSIKYEMIGNQYVVYGKSCQ